MYKRFCNLQNKIRVVFITSKIRDYFSTKDSLTKRFNSYVVYLITCARCKSFYVGRTHKHLTNRIEEHLGTESSSIFQHLQKNFAKTCVKKSKF